MTALVWAVEEGRAVVLLPEVDKKVAAQVSVEKNGGEWNPASGCADMYRQTEEHSGYT